MPLPKEFLRPSFRLSAIPKHQFRLGIGVGILQVIVVYLLATYIREALRWSPSTMTGEPWLFSEEERQFYNFFFALVSLVWGQSTCIFIWLTGTSRDIIHHHYRNHRRDILNDHQVLLWAMLLFLLNSSKLYAIYFGHDNHHYTFSFYPDYWLLFMGFVVVIFLHQWLTLRRKFRFSLKNILGIGIGYVCIAALLSFVNIADHQQMDTAHRDYKRLSTYQLDLPSIISAEHLRKMRKDMDIFLMYPKTDTLKQNPVHLWVENRKVNFDDLVVELESHKLRVPRYNISHIVYRLHIDKKTPYGTVKQLKQKLQVYDCLKVSYMGLAEGYKKNKVGQLYLLPSLCEKEKKLARAKIKNSHLLPVLPPAPPCLLQRDTQEENVVLIEVKAQNQLFVEGQETDIASMYSLLRTFILFHQEKLVFDLNVDEEVGYGFYMQVMSSLIGTYKEIRNESAMIHFGELYNDLPSKNTKKIRLKYPLKIVEK